MAMSRSSMPKQMMPTMKTPPKNPALAAKRPNKVAPPPKAGPLPFKKGGKVACMKKGGKVC